MFISNGGIAFELASQMLFDNLGVKRVQKWPDHKKDKMKEQRSNYNELPKEINNQRHDLPLDDPLNQLADVIKKGSYDFNLSMLFEAICKKLHPLFSIDCGALVLYDKGLTKIVKSYISIYGSAGEGVFSVAISNDPVSLTRITAAITAFGFPVLMSRQNWIEETGENHFPHPSGENYLFHCYIPLEINNEVLGTLALHNHQKELSAEGLAFCCNIADLLAELVSAENDSQPENATVGDHPQIIKDYNLLLSLTSALALVKEKEELTGVIRKYISQVFQFSYIEILQEITDHCTSLVNEIAEEKFCINLRMETISSMHAVDQMDNVDWKPGYINRLKSLGVCTLLVSPLHRGNEFIGVILIGLNDDHIVTPSEQLLLQGIGAQLAVTLDNLLAYDKIKTQLQEITACRQQLEEEKLYLPEEIQPCNSYSNIIGDSKEMQQVFNMLSNVSGSETTVLILGETGTGKELIAKAIHNNSDRKNEQMVKVNCAAIPPNLIESELFGHEKGSFTGATERRIGKFELANNSTLFLDEIGELSLELQVKLLRVLQEKEIERVGGKTTIPTDVRIVSATNRNLIEEVAAGRFRSDLFYRLNVFPIALPPLRKRKEDIPLLATHFLSRFTSKSGKKIDGFTQKVLNDMMRYYWPGNIRELEHLIERQVLLTKGPVIKELEIPSDHKTIAINGTAFVTVKTITENERDHIFAVLKMCNGKISGKDGAAKLLAVPATTLNSKIKRLGLAKKHLV